MKTLTYIAIENRTQYNEYCKLLESLVENQLNSEELHLEIALLTLLIGNWDAEHNTFNDITPVQLF